DSIGIVKNLVIQSSNRNINIIVTTEDVVLIPTTAKSYQQFQILDLFLDTLVAKDPEFGYMSRLASNWVVSENGKEYAFTIDGNAAFHDGSAVRPIDVVNAVQSHLSADSRSILRPYLANVLKSVEVVDENRVKFTLLGPYPAFIDLLSMPGFGIYKIDRQNDEEVVLGTGPFKYLGLSNEGWCLKRNLINSNYKGNIDQVCIRRVRDVEATIEELKSKKVDLSLGSPLEVARAMNAEEGFVKFPNQGLVVTHALLNLSKPNLKSVDTRNFIKRLFETLKSKDDFLTEYDTKLNTFFPRGIMPESYYEGRKVNKVASHNHLKELSILFPKGIFLKKTKKMIVEELNKNGIEVHSKSLKGKEYLEEILESNFDILIAPYQGVFPDPDGFLEMLDPNSILKNMKIPVAKLFKELKNFRFKKEKGERLSGYTKAFKDWENNSYIIPISQNGIPVVFNKRISIPDMNFGFHLSLRDVRLK
ncbi:MAG TPA: hypothetical protein DCL41_06340, partial [Bdellovibrionales bacterium]|nr:hypothetical protein [Bdellovibrionales bacterium]